LIACPPDDPQLPVAVDAKDPGVLAIDAVEVARAAEGELLGPALRERRAGFDVADRSRVPGSSAARGGG
jgi:hypothetical protein